MNSGPRNGENRQVGDGVPPGLGTSNRPSLARLVWPLTTCSASSRPQPVRGVVLITAIVLLRARSDRIPEVAALVAAIDGVREVYSVTGDVDLVAIVRVERQEALADIIADHLGKVDGVTRTRTYLAFRAYSPADVDDALNSGF
jgi:DNA-binding Lrp family transcriptional regulator